MATTCGNCGGKTRKGMARRAWVLADGVLKPARICAGCFGKSVPVVTPPPTTLAPACATPGCKAGRAKFCEVCVDALARSNRELTASNTVLGTRPRRFPAIERAAMKKARKA